MGSRQASWGSAAVGSMRLAGIVTAAVTLLTAIVSPALAQYNAGSSGIHGAFPPAAVPATAKYLIWNLRSGLIRYCTTYDEVLRPDTCTAEISNAQILGIPAGGLLSLVYEFTNFDLAGSPTQSVLELYPVGYDGPTPLTILSQNSFRLNRVTFHLDGQVGASIPAGIPLPGFVAPGGRPGPGGFAGGSGGRFGSPATDGNPGLGPNGGVGGVGSTGGTASSITFSTSLVPVVGGSGGGGGGGHATACGFRGYGGGGGGGAGAMLVAANVQIALESSGTITATGGGGGSGCPGNGGGGANGSVRLAAPTITGAGGGVFVGATGALRLEGNLTTFTGSLNVTVSRGSVLGTPQPAIPASFPTLRITSVGGIAVGQNPTGSPSTPDVTFASAPSGPVAIDLAAASIPIGTTVSVRAAPIVGAPTSVTSAALTGTLASSTASASLTIPAGAGVITAVTSFPVTSALLDRLPSIPGMKPALIEVTADASGASRMFLIGEDSKRVELTMGVNGMFAVVP